MSQDCASLDRELSLEERNACRSPRLSLSLVRTRNSSCSDGGTDMQEGAGWCRVPLLFLGKEHVALLAGLVQGRIAVRRVQRRSGCSSSNSRGEEEERMAERGRRFLITFLTGNLDASIWGASLRRATKAAFANSQMQYPRNRRNRNRYAAATLSPSCSLSLIRASIEMRGARAAAYLNLSHSRKRSKREYSRCYSCVAVDECEEREESFDSPFFGGSSAAALDCNAVRTANFFHSFAKGKVEVEMTCQYIIF